MAWAASCASSSLAPSTMVTRRRARVSFCSRPGCTKETGARLARSSPRLSVACSLGLRRARAGSGFSTFGPRRLAPGLMRWIVPCRGVRTRRWRTWISSPMSAPTRQSRLASSSKCLKRGTCLYVLVDGTRTYACSVLQPHRGKKTVRRTEVGESWVELRLLPGHRLGGEYLKR